jgi:hypothetical protein
MLGTLSFSDLRILGKTNSTIWFEFKALAHIYFKNKFKIRKIYLLLSNSICTFSIKMKSSFDLSLFGVLGSKLDSPN